MRGYLSRRHGLSKRSRFAPPTVGIVTVYDFLEFAARVSAERLEDDRKVEAATGTD